MIPVVSCMKPTLILAFISPLQASLIATKRTNFGFWPNQLSATWTFHALGFIEILGKLFGLGLANGPTNPSANSTTQRTDNQSGAEERDPR